MKKSLMLLIIPIVIGSSLLIISVIDSYPVMIDTPYEFKFDNINYFYWISISILLGSFYLVSINTENNNLKYVLSIFSFILIHSQDLLHYTIGTSDNNFFTSLMDVFMHEDVFGSTYSYAYYQRPVFFIFNTISLSLTSINYNTYSFIVYMIFGILMSSLIYNYISRKGGNGYAGVIIFIFSVYWYFNFQSVPYTMSLLILFYMFYLDKNKKTNDNINLLIYLSFGVLSFTHILTPILFIIYCFFNYYLSKSEEYKKLFLTTFILYLGINVYGQLFSYYLERISVINLGEFERRVARATSTTIAQAPFIESLSQFISKTITIGSWVISSIGFLSGYKNKKLDIKDYSIVLTGVLFTPFIFISFQGYSQLFFRAFPLIILVFSYSASYFIQKNTNKIVTIIFVIVTMSYIFVPIQQSFYDKGVYFITERQENMNEFYHENFPYIYRAELLTDKRNLIFLRTSYPTQSRYNSPSFNFTQNFDEYDYILYTIALGKSILEDRPLNESITTINEEKFNIIYNSGSYTQVYARARPRKEQTIHDLRNMALEVR